MDTKGTISPERLQLLMYSAKFGWWKADFNSKHYLCSDYIIKMLGLKSEILTFEEFRLFIREDHQERIAQEFDSIKTEDVYEQIFPIITSFGEIWIHSILGQKEIDEQGHLIAWGTLQHINNPQEIQAEKMLEKFNTHLHQQNNISRSLYSFLQTEDTQEVINKILKNLLDQQRGDRAYIFEYNWDNYTQKCSFEVTAESIEPQQEILGSFSIDDTPWWTREITAHNSIILSSLDDLPPETKEEKEILAMQGIKSLMVIPMLAQDKVWGYMGIDTVTQQRIWKPEDYQWFATLGNIISICMELHRAKNKALKDQEYLKNLFRYMPVAYVRMQILYDAKGKPYDYQFKDLNPAFEKITGRKAEDFVNKTARECTPNQNIENDIESLLKVQGTQDYLQFHYQNHENDSYYRAIIYSSEKDMAVCLFSDITDIEKAHRALERSEKELRNIYRNIPVGIEIYDKNGNLQDLNKKDMEIFGVKDKSTVIGVSLFDNPNIPDEVKNEVRQGKNVDFKIKYSFNNLSDYYSTSEQGVKDLIVKLSILYTADNELENYMLIIIDNTETSSAFSKIQEFENFFSIIADFAKVGYFKWNLYEKTGFALEQWFKNWGEPENTKLEEVIGVYSMLHPDDRPKIMHLYEQLTTGQIKGSKEEVRVNNGKGGWKWIRTTVVVTKFDPEHRNVELIGVNFDITELKEIEAKLIDAKNKAETLDKLKSAFLANMSHEIRTPLNAIVGFSNLLAETSDFAEQKQYIAIIQENNDLLLQLISDILDLSKIEAGTFEIIYGDVDVNILCDEIVRSQKLKTPIGVALEFENYEPECHIWSDRNRLMQVINNFINNAQKFTTHGSIKLGYRILNDRIKFYVSDTGIGITKANLSTVFERFVKLNSFIHGTGLGLSICKSMIEQMGGEIGVESEEGKGSEFWFTLPYASPEIKVPTSQSTEISAEAEEEHLSDKPVILVAEDTESNYVLISTILKKDYSLLWAHTGREALEMYKKQHPDIILMDVRMPEMDGLTATKCIREYDSQIPIIALTAFAFDSDKENTLKAGCNAFISKPINTPLLKDTIKSLLS